MAKLIETPRSIYVDCQGTEYAVVQLSVQFRIVAAKRRELYSIPTFSHPFIRFGSAQAVLNRFAKEAGLLDVLPYWEKEQTNG
jgi:hypothetical protein